MKYYYISYMYAKGFGACTFAASKYLDFKGAKKWIEKETKEDSVTIMFVTEITKEQFEVGI